MTLLIGSLQLGFLYGLMVLGLYISFRILNIPDLTTEGSFVFGLSLSAMMTLFGHPLLGLFLGFLGGFGAGALTGLLQTKLQIHPILAGILTMTGLYSWNILVLGGSPNQSLSNDSTIVTLVRGLLPGVDKEVVKLGIALLMAVLAVILLLLFFRTHVGLCIRAVGDNEEMLKASSVNVDGTKILALALANGLIGFCGGLVAQFQNFADVNSGAGVLIFGLASVIIGEAFMGRKGYVTGFISAILGSIIYRFIIAAATRYTILPSYMLKFLSALIVGIALALPAMKGAYRKHQIRKGGARYAGN